LYQPRTGFSRGDAPLQPSGDRGEGQFSKSLPFSKAGAVGDGRKTEKSPAAAFAPTGDLVPAPGCCRGRLSFRSFAFPKAIEKIKVSEKREKKKSSFSWKRTTH